MGDAPQQSNRGPAPRKEDREERSAAVNPYRQYKQEIEQKMDELAREYHETHDPEIPEEIFELARRLKEMDH
jgi:uncharacterized protein YcbK (DUF882 family)